MYDLENVIDDALLTEPWGWSYAIYIITQIAEAVTLPENFL
jgi:hypothetical protein